MQPDDKKTMGIVTLVGAGPGRADLMTLAGLKALQAADVVLHDALVDPEILTFARKDARLIAVGKRCGKASASQQFINRTLVNLAKQGHTIVRLKCGDPFIFGRGGEELEALKEAGVPYEVIPGVTAASAAAADAGLPLTHRGVARRITFMTAQTGPNLAADSADWKALLTGGTVALYMARKNLGEILASITDAGFSSDLPAVLVANAGRPERVIINATIGTAAQFVSAIDGNAPMLALVGESVSSMSSSSLSSMGQLPFSAELTQKVAVTG